MNKLRSWIIGIVLLLIVGYSAFWYYHAHLLKTMFEEKRGHAEQTPSQDLTLNFDQIETGGFPFSIELSFLNPKFDVARKNDLVNIGVSLNGKMINSFTPFGRLKKVQTEGKTHITVRGFDSKPIFDGVADGKMTLHSKFKGYIWSAVQHPFGTKKDDFEDLDLHLEPLHLEPLQFSWLSYGKPAGDLQITDAEFHYQANPSSQIITLASDFVINIASSVPASLDEIKALNEPKNQLEANLEPFLAILTKAVEKYKPERTSCLLDAKIEIPGQEVLQKISQNPMSLMSEPFPKFSIEVKKLNTSNAFGDFQHSGYITVSEDSPKLVTIKFANDAKNTHTEVYYTKTLALVDDIAKMLETEPTANNEDLARVKALFHDHLDAVKAIIPKLQKLGTNIWTGKGSFEVNRENFNFSGNATDCGFKDDLYGFLFNVDAKRSDVNLNCKVGLDCIKYKALIQDLTEYFNRFTVVFNFLKRTDVQNLNPISEKTKEKLLEYLTAISDAPKSTSPDLKITVNYDNGKMMVGTLDFGTFVAYSLYLQDMLRKEICPLPAKQPVQQPAQKP